MDEKVFRRALQSKHKSSRRPIPSPVEIDSSMELASVQPIRRISPNRSADDAPVPERSEGDPALTHAMTPPMVVGPTAINPPFWAGRDQIPPTLEQDSTSTPSVFPAPSDLPGPGSWDRFYVNGHGFWQWDGFYVDENGIFQWDDFYVGKNDLLQNVGRDSYIISTAPCLPPTESEFSDSRGFLRAPVDSLDCAGDAEESG